MIDTSTSIHESESVGPWLTFHGIQQDFAGEILQGGKHSWHMSKSSYVLYYHV
jgi:hypothetical protein